MSISLVQMRNIARLQALQNGSDVSLYTPSNLDTAILGSFDDFIDNTKFTKRTDVITLATGTAALPTCPTNFTSGRLLSAYMTSVNVQSWNGIYGQWSPLFAVGQPAWGPLPFTAFDAELTVVSIEQYINARQGYPQTQQPACIAFDTFNTGFVYPTPDQDYTLTFRWYEPMTPFAAGTQGAWVSGTQYYVGDIVSVSTHGWYCNTPVANAVSPAAPTWTDLGVMTVTDPNSITCPTNLPDNVARDILIKGTPAFFMFNKPEMLQAAQAQFEAMKLKYIRLGSLGVTAGVRGQARSAGYGDWACGGAG